jgi:hypothetical protein
MTDRNRYKQPEEPKVLLATITAEQCRYYEYYDSLDTLILPPGSSKIRVHSSSPAQNRNLVIRKALEQSFTHIMFTDDDHVFTPDTVMRLLSRDVDIVSGLYCMKFPPFPPIAFNKVTENGMCQFTDMREHASGELMDSVACPAGALLVKMGVFKKISPPWFTLGQIAKDGWCDDLWFCQLAREAGYKIYVDTLVPVGHLTKCILTPMWNGETWVIQHQINSEYTIDVGGTGPLPNG